MRRSLLRRLTVASFLVFILVAPVQAAPRGDDSPSALLDRVIAKVVHLIKRVVVPLEDIQPTLPRP